MKKLLVLLLVLGITTMASAYTVTFEYRDAAGTTPISEVDIASPSFTLAVVGTYVGGDANSHKMYDQFENIGAGSDYADFTGSTMFAAAGGFKALGSYNATYDGYDLSWGDASTGQTDADMFLFSLTASAEGTLNISTYDSDYTAVLETFSIPIVPEPMTIALLGLGGLFLRRRRK